MAAFVVQAVSTESFDEAYRRLRKGRDYTAQADRTRADEQPSADGVEHHFAAQRAGRPTTRRRSTRSAFSSTAAWADAATTSRWAPALIGALAGAEQIYVIPYAWYASPWWSDDQVDNLHAIVDAVKRRYNVDENRVVVSGVSDGGTGAYYVAMRDTTPYASFLPLNGYWMVLASRDIDDGEIFANNLRNKPLFIVNGGRDPLYPTRVVDPYVEHYKKGGVSLEYHPQPEAGHNTQWWPEVKDPFEAFVQRASAPAAARRADLGNRRHLRAQPCALARHRPARIGEGRSEVAGRSERDGDAARRRISACARSARASTA